MLSATNGLAVTSTILRRSAFSACSAYLSGGVCSIPICISTSYSSTPTRISATCANVSNFSNVTTSYRLFHNTRACQLSSSSTSSPSSSSPASSDSSADSSSELLSSPRERLDFDVLIVGGGPSGLSAAIRLKQLAKKQNKEISVCVIEKGSEIGSHILSGNVFEPRALNELIPDWQEKGAPLKTKVIADELHFLFNHKSSVKLPVPSSLHNDSNYIISLGALCRWLGSQAEALGVEIYPGFAASELIYENNSVVGVATADLGIGKDGKIKDNFQRGMELRAGQTIFAEGCRGSLSEQLMEKYELRKDCDPQTYGIGFKEVWEIDPKKNNKGKAGMVRHTFGWPVQSDTWGGSFMYHIEDNKVLVGYVVGLDYANPYISPYQEFQRHKLHPILLQYLEGGKCISYGARAINEGGWQSIPKLTFPGGMLVGCSAGFLNVPKIKGSQNAMKSGMLAAEAIFEAVSSTQSVAAADSTVTQILSHRELTAYETSVRSSWINDDLYAVRNYHPSFQKWGTYGFAMYSALSSWVLKGREPWTFRNHRHDWEKTGEKNDYADMSYPKADGQITFDLLSNLQRSGVSHNEDQRPHLTLRKSFETVPQTISLQKFAAPESRFCPAKVYEYVPSGEKDETTGEEKLRLQINFTNCVHCKTCDIKTPHQFIRWTVPEGGGGPKYAEM